MPSAKRVVTIRRIQYGKILEGVTFQHSTADYLFMLLFGGGAMLVSRPPLAATAIIWQCYISDSIKPEYI